MSRVCEFTGKSVQSGNNVSHAINRTRRVFRPNLFETHFHSESLDRNFKFKISARAQRSVDHSGGLDAFLLKARDTNLSDKAVKLKNEIAAVQGK